MSRILDYSWARPAVAEIKAAGYAGVMRYLSPDPTKNLSAEERDELRAAGLSIGLVWESSAQRALGGQPAGQQDALQALEQAGGLGYPAGCAIYFAVDFAPTAAEMPVVIAYFQGVARVLPVARIGAYGSYDVVDRLIRAGLISYGWQTLAWSGGLVHRLAALYQSGEQAFGERADVNQQRADHGAWAAQEDDMFTDQDRAMLQDVHTGMSGLVSIDPGKPQPLVFQIRDELGSALAQLTALEAATAAIKVDLEHGVDVSADEVLQRLQDAVAAVKAGGGGSGPAGAPSPPSAPTQPPAGS